MGALLLTKNVNPWWMNSNTNMSIIDQQRKKGRHTIAPAYNSNRALDISISSMMRANPSLCNLVTSTTSYLSSAAPRREMSLAGNGKYFGCVWNLRQISQTLNHNSKKTGAHHPSSSLTNLVSQSSFVSKPNHFSSSRDIGISWAAHWRWDSNTNLLSRSMVISFVGLSKRSPGLFT